MQPVNRHTITAQVEAAWAAHRSAARRYIVRRDARIDDALVDDAIAETALQLQTWLTRGKPMPEHPRAWFCRVAWHEYLRAAGRNHRIDLDNGLIDRLPSEHDEASEIVEQLTADELAAAFAQALARLTERQRTVIVEYAQGRSYQEIASRHGLSATATNKAIVRAKRRLADDGRLTQALQRLRK